MGMMQAISQYCPHSTLVNQYTVPICAAPALMNGSLVSSAICRLLTQAGMQHSSATTCMLLGSQLNQAMTGTIPSGLAYSTSSGAPGGPPKSRERWYKSVHVSKTQDGQYHVMLDKRPVRTPGKHTLVLPSYPLALAIAAEWEWQATGKPQMYSMPLMSLAATALDQPKPRQKVIDTLLKYVHTDATVCRLESSKVAARQGQLHDPLLMWAREHLDWVMVPTDKLFSPPPDADTVQSVKKLLEECDAFQLAAIEQLTMVCKSIVIATALLKGRIGIQEALRAARVEEDCQMEEWGAVEAGHDLDIADVTTRIVAPSLFLRLLALREGTALANTPPM